MNSQVSNFLTIMKYVLNGTSSEKLPELTEPVDWDAISEIAKAHNVFALFHEVAYKFPTYRDSKHYEENARKAMIMVAQQIKKTDAFLMLYQKFIDNNIHPIVMKGIICRQLYGEYSEHRPSGDEDIFIKKDEFFGIKEILEESGYECEYENVTHKQIDKLQHISFKHKVSRLTIEVHTNMMGHRNKMRTQMSNCFTDVFKNWHEEKIKFVPIHTMSHEEHFLYLVLHAFRHFTERGAGIRQIMDILLYQKKYEEYLNWTRIENMLLEMHVIKYLGDVQYIGAKYLGIDLVNRFETEEPEALLEDIIDAGVFGKMERTDIMAGNIAMEVMNHEKKGFYAWLRAGFPPRRQMLDWAPHLEEKPWLLPVEWIKRWGRFLERARKYEGNLMKESLKKSQKRLELIKKYGL